MPLRWPAGEEPALASGGMRPEDVIWNRACDWYASPFDARPGDLALRDMIYFHGLAMNGGALHALETVGKNGTRAALTAYRFFGLHAAATAVAWLLEAVERAEGLSDDDAFESIEEQADARYYAAVPDDEVLVAAFERTYGRSAEDFVPVG